MDSNEFRTILLAFADKKDDLVLSRGKLLVQVHNELIEADVFQRSGSLYVREGDKEQSAQRWLAERIAMLDVLAERVQNTVAANPTFVAPRGELVDSIRNVPQGTPKPTDNAFSSVREFLDRRPGGTCSVLYLTSDAGEGKTTLINQLAVKQAKLFRSRESEWLLIPIALGGRPFLRFDEIVVAALMNQLRFPRLYFDAFLHLVRLGFIVPALDGFEEIFVETPEGDAVSGLGTLITQLHGEGTLLIAARKAYFEFKELRTQALLLDAIPDVDVGFGRLKLERWRKQEFVEYAFLNGVPEPEVFYDDVVARVGDDHPLVTRAVLVRRLVEIAKGSSDRTFIANLRPETEAFFSQFIDTILEREVTEKWIDKLGDPARPLLSIQDHHALLGYLAEEMWISKTGFLLAEMVDSLVDIFCESSQLSPIVARQVRERIKQHALIVAASPGGRTFAFDHENFRHFFLGEQLGRYLCEGSLSYIRKLLRIDALPVWTLDTAVGFAIQNSANLVAVLKQVLEVGRSEGPSSYVRENSGNLCMRLLEEMPGERVVVKDLVFSLDSLTGASLHGVTFQGCYFRPTGLHDCQISDCHFEDCEFERLAIPELANVTNTKMGKGCRIRAVVIPRDEDSIDVYDPERINVLLARVGFIFEVPVREAADSLPEHLTDLKLQVAEKAIRTFQRCTHVSDGTLRLRLSVHSAEFFDSILPDLLNSGVFERVKSNPDRVKLGLPLSIIATVMEESRGSYDRFIETARRKRPQGRQDRAP